MTEAHGRFAYADISVGEKAAFSVLITDELVDEFGNLSGNLNPLHMDEEYGRRSVFHHRIAHGMLAGCLFSRLLGMYLPGEHSLCLSQTLQFRRPVMIGVELTIRGEVLQKTDSSKTITVLTVAEDSHTGEVLVSGEALVRLLK